MAQQLNCGDVNSFRFGRHKLARRLPRGSLPGAAAVCGIRNAPPWAAALSFVARIEGMASTDLEQAVCTEKTLIQTWSLRQTPVFIPVDDLDVFTVPLIPGDDRSMREFLHKVVPLFDRVSWTATEAVQLTAAIICDELDGRTLSKPELSAAIGRRLPPEILPWCDRCQSHHVYEPQMCVASFQRVFCVAPRANNRIQFVRTDQWLGRALAPVNFAKVGAELVRRYLRAYAPSEAVHFGDWAGIPLRDAHRLWSLVAPELDEVCVDGVRRWILADDRTAFTSPPAAEGVRFLPPGDPYLLLRDRETLVPDPSTRKALWRPTGSPGTLFVEGQLVGTWRQRDRGRTLVVTIELLKKLDKYATVQVEEEARVLARFRGSESAELDIA